MPIPCYLGVLRVLVACEESQAVTKELRKLGHEAFSCDLLPESGGHPEWHLQHDVTRIAKSKMGYDNCLSSLHLFNCNWE